MAKKNQLVVPNEGRWSVRSEGAKRASKTYDTQQEAIAVATERARRDCVELLIHGRNGEVRERRSFR
ncbi:MAG: DUF2188 domain-containing protein [Acuticoccus sp.]